MKLVKRWLIRQVLTAYADHELSLSEAALVNRALRADPILMGEYVKLEALNALLASDARSDRSAPLSEPLIPITAHNAWLPNWVRAGDLYADLRREPWATAASIVLGLLAGLGPIIIGGMQ